MNAGDSYGCFCVGPFEPVAGAPLGPLRGLTFAVKDLIDTVGSVTGAGNPDWRRTHTPATANAPVVQHLLEAGATMVGRTITDELAFSLEGKNFFEGTPVNPAAPDRLPGGSSSGSAVAVAAGLVDFALGTDTGGSVRVPAAFCGVYGLRPTHGVIPTAGVVPFAPSLDTVGWLARDAATLARVGDVLLPKSTVDPVRRVFVARDAFALADQDVQNALDEAVRRMALPSEALDVFPDTADDMARTYQVAQAMDIVAALGPWLKAVQPRFGPAIAPTLSLRGQWRQGSEQDLEAGEGRTPPELMKALTYMGTARVLLRSVNFHQGEPKVMTAMVQRKWALHSITLSARVRRLGGISRPSAFAVFRLITSSNLVGCSTGRSAGFAPLKILSTKEADRRNRS